MSRPVVFSLAIAATLAVTACGSGDNPAGPEGAPSVALLGRWNLILLHDAVEGSEHVVEEPGTFAVEFLEGGRFSAKADCNVCNGGYEAEAGVLSVDPLVACTLAYCQSAPLDTRFVGVLTRAQRYRLDADLLEITSSEGRLVLRAAG